MGKYSPKTTPINEIVIAKEIQNLKRFDMFDTQLQKKLMRMNVADLHELSRVEKAKAQINLKKLGYKKLPEYNIPSMVDFSKKLESMRRRR